MSAAFNSSRPCSVGAGIECQPAHVFLDIDGDDPGGRQLAYQLHRDVATTPTPITTTDVPGTSRRS